MPYPFSLINAFFDCLEFQREDKVPPGTQTTFVAEIKVGLDNYPTQFQVNLRLKSQEENHPIKVNMELIGLFRYSGNDPSADKDRIIEFLNNRGLFMLWPYLHLMIKSVTTQMGIEGLNLTPPAEFSLNAELSDEPTKTANSQVE
jgi:preprotein translocase subunit SecB